MDSDQKSSDKLAKVFLNEELQVPSFVMEIGQPFEQCFSALWLSEALSLAEKIECLDRLVNDNIQLRDIRKKYRLWRFKFVKEEIFDFLKGEDEGLQWAINSMCEETDNLEELASSIWHLRTAFNDESKYIAFLEREALKSPDSLFPDFAWPKYVDLMCRWLYEEDMAGSKTWRLSIALQSSALTEPFLRLVCKTNSYGPADSALSLVGCVLSPSGPFSVHFVVPVPFHSPLLFYPISNPEVSSCQLPRVGDVFLCFYDMEKIKQLRKKFKEGDHSDFSLVGKITDMPKELTFKEQYASTRPHIEIVDTKINYKT